jgi:hypothetical protein
MTQESSDPSGLQGLTKLRYLNLSENSFIGNDTIGSLGKLASLEVLHLFRCNISGALPNTGTTSTISNYN